MISQALFSPPSPFLPAPLQMALEIKWLFDRILYKIAPSCEMGASLRTVLLFRELIISSSFRRQAEILFNLTPSCPRTHVQGVNQFETFCFRETEQVIDAADSVRAQKEF